MGNETDSHTNDYDYETETHNSLEENWYSGGTLHKSDISEWKNSTEKNQLATCADFVAVVNKDMKISDLKFEAQQLKDCINEATRGLESTNSMKVSEIASQCMILMK